MSNICFESMYVMTICLLKAVLTTIWLFRNIVKLFKIELLIIKDGLIGGMVLVGAFVSIHLISQFYLIKIIPKATCF